MFLKPCFWTHIFLHFRSMAGICLLAGSQDALMHCIEYSPTAGKPFCKTISTKKGNPEIPVLLQVSIYLKPFIKPLAFSKGLLFRYLGK